MKNTTNWKIFFILLAASLTSAVLVLPYIFSLSPKLAQLISPALIIAQMIQALVLFSLAIFFGLRLAKRIGFRFPLLESLAAGEKFGVHLRSIWAISVEMGVLAGSLIILLSFFFTSLSIDFLKAEVAASTWKRLLACFYGGITEEILFRLFLVSFLVWLSMKIKKAEDGKPTAVGVWVAIVLSAILFGLGHLPITGELTAINLPVIARAILLNGIPGIIFGWLYWKKGLESAMLAHFSADIVIHVIVPTTATFLL